MSATQTASSTASNRGLMIALLVLSGVIISVGMGLRQSLGLFMRPMTVDAGVTAATFGFSLALQNIIWGFAQPVVGAFADRHGARPVLIGTTLLYALGLALMVFAGKVPGILELTGFLTGVGVAGTGLGVLIGTVSRATPPERRTQTVGIVAAAGSLGMMVIAPLGQWIINSYGWQAGIVVFALIAASMVRSPSAAVLTSESRVMICSCIRSRSSRVWTRPVTSSSIWFSEAATSPSSSRLSIRERAA